MLDRTVNATTIYVERSNADRIAQLLVSESQDLAALANLFLTDAVEHSVLATHLGYGTVLISALFALGLLGIVESYLKASLGLEICRAADFNIWNPCVGCLDMWRANLQQAEK